jgi:carboxypeptidase PM20D1
LKKFLLFFISILLVLIIIIGINTLLFKSKQTGVLGQRRIFPIDSNAVNHLSEAIRIQTVSFDLDDSLKTSVDLQKKTEQNILKFIPVDNAEITKTVNAFDSLYFFLEKTYPKTFKKLDIQRINRHSLLFHWKGRGIDKKPVILYAHSDVVPAYSESDSVNWSHAPFDGNVDENFIYGRGAIDDKGSMISILEAVEKLVSKNFIPSRDIYLAFGHDEEAGGEQGAVKIAEELQKKGVKAEFLMDEGGLVAVDMVPFVKPPVALIFTAEKGYMSLQLSVTGHGGHSSFPPKDPPVEILCEALLKIHEHKFNQRMTESVDEFMDYAGPEMQLPFKSLFANRWLFKPIIFNEYAKIPSANAMLRTTSVATKINGGTKENVIPSEVHATINFRLLPGDKSSDVIESVKKIVDDPRVKITVLNEIEEASEISSVNTDGFKIIHSTINTVFPDAIVAPSLLIAQTDSRHFRKVTENIFRFLPLRMNDEILDSMHGLNEKIGKQELMESIEFYQTLIEKL